jgi:hypothetical protein
MAPFAQLFYPRESGEAIVSVKLDFLYLNCLLYSVYIVQLDKVGV